MWNVNCVHLSIFVRIWIWHHLGHWHDKNLSKAFKVVSLKILKIVFFKQGLFSKFILSVIKAEYWLLKGNLSQHITPSFNNPLFYFFLCSLASSQMPGPLPFWLHCQISQITARSLWLTYILMKQFYFAVTYGGFFDLFFFLQDGLTFCYSKKRNKWKMDTNNYEVCNASYDLFSTVHFQN